jgi:hypothetical protein
MALEADRHRFRQVLPLLQAYISIGPSGSIRGDGRRDQGHRCDNDHKKSERPSGVHWHSAKTSFMLSSNLERKGAFLDYSLKRSKRLIT